MTTIHYVTNIFKDFQPGTLDNINVFLKTVNLHKVLPLQSEIHYTFKICL
jgi:hypothetical protein